MLSEYCNKNLVKFDFTQHFLNALQKSLIKKNLETFWGAVSGSQQNCEEDTEISHILPASTRA